MTAAEKVLAVAQGEIGYLEKSAETYREHGMAALRPKTEYAGSDNYTKYGYDMHSLEPTVMDFPAAWCDAFVDWCFYTALGDAAARRALRGSYDDYTKNSASLYIHEDALVLRGKGKPEPGWQIFFSKDGTFSGIHHTGIVSGVDSTRVYTIEGNTSGAVGVVANGGGVWGKSYQLDDGRIFGYGVPDYQDDEWRWIKSDGIWYYQDADGANSYGWRLIKETHGEARHWYFFNSKGQMQTGLLEDDGSVYYLQPDGPLEGARCVTDARDALVVKSE